MKPTARKLTILGLCTATLLIVAVIALIPVLASITNGTGNVVYYDQCSSSQISFAEALDSIGVDRSRANRALIAAVNGISDYTGDEAQDAILLDLLKNGKLVQSMPSPVETTVPTEATTAPTDPPRTVEYYNTYGEVDKITDLGSCPSMQGMAVGSTYIYTVKINSDNSSAFISMTHKDTGDTTTLINNATGGYYFYNLGHANDMDVWGIDGNSHIFVTSTNKGDGAIVRLKRSGSYLTQVASYNLTYNGSEIAATAMAIESVSGGMINFLIKNGTTVYSGSVSTSATSATIALTKEFNFDKSQAYINGSLIDLSSYVNQGFDYYKGRLYVPLSGDDDELNRSVVLVYDIENASGTVYPDQYLSFRITSSTYSALFEIESCGICSGDGKLYFNTNRRKTTSDTNHDGIHYFENYVDENY